MSPAMAARWAFVCALITSFGMGSAYAERRPVAVVNLDLSDTSPAKALADRLDPTLVTHSELSGLLSSTDASALKDPIEDPDQAGLETARESLRAAEDALFAFNYGNAQMFADTGRKALLSVTPTAARKLYSELTFVRGQASLASGQTNDALTEFALLARLDPSRTLDPARYLPQVVQLFAQAKSTASVPGSITVDGVGTVWIDGEQVGTAPGGFSVSEGLHVVWVTEPAHNTGGGPAVVRANAATIVTIKPDTAQRKLIVQRARLALAQAADATARAGAMNNLAKLVDVRDAILLHVSNGKVIVQTWHTGSDVVPLGFSSLREYTAKEKPIDILTQLAPPKKIEPIEPPIPVKPIVVKKWYQKRSYQVGIAAGVVAAIVGVYFASQPGADDFGFNPDLGFDTLTTGRQ